MGFLAAVAIGLWGDRVTAKTIDRTACQQDGHPLYGKVQIVESFPDLTVQVVDSFPNLKVKPVNSFPDSCGEWQFVNSFPDLKIKFVTSFPDLKIQFVDSFPGLT
ncbi:MAG: hypothetical protein EA001_08630 [Oscillatoriales cyanobacterium]|nr:MAG: hypothetical protein EA001_08630 [Oscillatoriales cyanobacterium]